jgi:hypothetical protein
MSDMRKLLESMDKFAGEPEQKSGDQVRGTDKAKKSGKDHPFKGRLVGSGAAESVEHGDDFDQLRESLMQEYKYFVKDTDNQAGDDKEAAGTSPVANINPPSQNQQRVVDEEETDPTTGQAAKPGAAPATGTTPAAPVAGQPPAKPGQPVAPTKPGQPQQQQQKPGTAPIADPKQVQAMAQLKSTIQDPKINPQQAAQAASVAKTDPTKLSPQQKQQLSSIGSALAQEITPENIPKIKSMLQQP